MKSLSNLHRYDTGAISSVLVQIGDDIQAGGLSDGEKEMITSALILGALLAALCAGTLADILGRKNVIGIADIVSSDVLLVFVFIYPINVALTCTMITVNLFGATALCRWRCYASCFEQLLGHGRWQVRHGLGCWCRILCSTSVYPRR